MTVGCRVVSDVISANSVGSRYAAHRNAGRENEVTRHDDER